MIPPVSILEMGNQYLRPDDKVDLSYVASPSIPGSLMGSQMLTDLILNVFLMVCYLYKISCSICAYAYFTAVHHPYLYRHSAS